MPLAKDLLHPTPEEERRTHKKKRLVQCPNSYFMDVKCPGCYKITTVFSHAQTVVLCVGCSTVLCQPTGGKARLTEGLFVFVLKLCNSGMERSYHMLFGSYHVIEVMRVSVILLMLCCEMRFDINYSRSVFEQKWVQHCFIRIRNGIFQYLYEFPYETCEPCESQGKMAAV
uniref:40S ribosomal protein S27 n=1 Tax=Cyprinus carpio carpio TaxID=630221 RepID=A0A9J7Z1G9_CYPCA